MARQIILLALALLLAACGAGQRSDLKLLDETLTQYGSAVRWGTPEQLLAFVDPEALKARPVREFDLERLRQLRVAGFRAQPVVMIGETRARLVAEVELINNNTQLSRSTTDITEWRWDATAERWWLASGLPTYAVPK